VLPGIRWGASWEYKDYQNFQLGVNEPPPLVREHSFALLNRKTHVVQALQETGHQVETRVDFGDVVELVANWSRADNRAGFEFRETYAEASLHWRGSTVTLFADDARDGIESVVDRETVGGYALTPLGRGHAIELDVERQRAAEGSAAFATRFEDRFVSLGWSLAGRASAAWVRQTTDDPSEATDPVTLAVSRRAYDALNASVTLGRNHELFLFWGRRRGGLACTAGTCYKVRSFDGVSARLVTRF
jgi:hypothetical protein